MVPNHVRYQTALHLEKNNGGEGGIRTLAPVTQPKPLAGVPLEPLEYFSVYLVNGGEGGIRTHGAVKHHWFSRPAP